MTAGIYDEAAFESFCGELIAASFSPLDGSAQRMWIGPVPDFIAEIAPAREMSVWIPDGWPVRAARLTIPDLIAPHVTASGYVCLWADDDPAQAAATAYADVLSRLRAWAESAAEGFGTIDRALDSYAMYQDIGGSAVELDLPDLLGTVTNGTTRSVVARVKGFWQVRPAGEAGHEREGVIFYRSKVELPPRNFADFQAALTRAQSDNLRHGLSRRGAVEHGKKSGGYDFAALVTPKYGQLDVTFLSSEGAGETLRSKSHRSFPNDKSSRLKRAGPRSADLAGSKVLVVGAGSVGGQVALTLAASGVTNLSISDDAKLRSVNLARHVVGEFGVGRLKTIGLSVRIEDAAPWCSVEMKEEIPWDPEAIRVAIEGYDLIVDCSGVYSVTIGLAIAALEREIPMITTSLYHSGDLFRIRRQASGDVPILERLVGAGYPKMPDSEPEEFGFLELGCTSPVHNSPPAAVTRAAADTALAALDFLLGDLRYPDDSVTVLNPVGGVEPFNKRGTAVLPVASGA